MNLNHPRAQAIALPQGGAESILATNRVVRNTYLLRVTNKEAVRTPVPFHVRVDGLPEAEVTVQDIRLGTTESSTVPLIVRVRSTPDMPRTINMTVHVSSPTREVEIAATFKTGGHIVN